MKSSLLFSAPPNVCWEVPQLTYYSFWFACLLVCFRRAQAFLLRNAGNGGGGSSVVKARRGCAVFTPGELLLRCPGELTPLPARSCRRAPEFSMDIVGRWILHHHEKLQMSTLGSPA